MHFDAVYYSSTTIVWPDRYSINIITSEILTLEQLDLGLDRIFFHITFSEKISSMLAGEIRLAREKTPQQDFKTNSLENSYQQSINYY